MKEYVVLYLLILGVLVVYIHCSVKEHFEDVSTKERNLVEKQRGVAVSAENAMCFDCSDFYSPALSQSNATTLLEYLKAHTIFVQQTLNAVKLFIDSTKDADCQTSISKYITCLKTNLQAVSCPHNIDDPGCKTSDAVVDAIISKAMLCVSDGSCERDINVFIDSLKKALAATTERFEKCKKEFETANGPCIDIYVNAIQNKMKAGSESNADILVSNAQMKEELNKNASFAIQAVYY